MPLNYLFSCKANKKSVTTHLVYPAQSDQICQVASNVIEQEVGNWWTWI